MMEDRDREERRRGRKRRERAKVGVEGQEKRRWAVGAKLERRERGPPHRLTSAPVCHTTK